MKKVVVAILSILGIAVHAAEEVNVYTHRHYDADQQLFNQFTAETGINVNVVKAKADQLMERLVAEGKNSPADVLMTADVGRLYLAKEKGLLKPLKSSVLESNVPANLRDADDYWFGVTKRARVVVYHKDRIKPSQLSTYAALADSQWKENVLIRSSSNIYNQSLVASWIANKGEAATEKLVKQFVNSFARKPKGSDRDQMRGVAAGEADLAVVNTYYLGKLVHGKVKDQKVAEQLKVFFPNQNTNGTHVNVSGMGVVKHAKNVDNAKKLMEFLTSNKAQKLFAEANYEYPVKPGVEASTLVKSWGTFKEDTVDLSKLGEFNRKAVMIMDRAGWK